MSLRGSVRDSANVNDTSRLESVGAGNQQARCAHGRDVAPNRAEAREARRCDLISSVGPLASHVKRTAVAALPGCIVDVRPTQAVVVALHKDACSSSDSMTAGGV